jgi:hypothetical protein
MIRLRTACIGIFAVFSLLGWSKSGHAQGTQPDPYGPSSPSGLQAGGLAPPGAGTSSTSSAYDPNAASTQQTLREADDKDSGRGLEFVWLNAEAGYEIVGLQTFSKNNLVDAGFTKTHQQGFLFGVGVGLRLIFLTVGPRFRLGTFNAWQLWTADLEAGLHLPLGRVEPYFTAGFGYASIGAFNASKTRFDMTGAGVNIHGLNARLGFGIDIYVTNVVTIGGNLTGDALFLKRPSVTAPQVPGITPEQQQQLDAVYRNDGTSVGAGMTATGVVGLHF